MVATTGLDKMPNAFGILPALFFWRDNYEKADSNLHSFFTGYLWQCLGYVYLFHRGFCLRWTVSSGGRHSRSCRYYATFTNQIQAMLKTNTFIQANTEAEGNLFYSVKEGYSHNGRAQTQYFYNALTWVWRSRTGDYTANTKISEVIQDSVFNDWGRLIFPVNSNYYSGTTLGNLSLTWYQNIYAGMGHGFGLGIGTIAEGWFHQAVAFWENNC